MNGGCTYREQLDARAAGRPLDEYLIERYRHSSPEEWRSRIEAGQLLLDGRPVHAATVLRAGQGLLWRRPPWREPAAPLAFAVLHDDGEVLAVAKPAGLPTLPGGGFFHSTLLHQVGSHASGAAPLHRLGRWTSGVVLFARTPAARAELARQFAERTVGKRYRALAAGSPGTTSFEVATPIGPVPHPLLGTVHGATPAGRPASSRVTVLERRDGAFLCDVTISTGRPHQIRIHLAAAGYPLAGDPLYGIGGVPAAGCRALPGDSGYLLHAAEISFRSPGSGRRTRIECAPPPALRVGSGDRGERERGGSS